MNYYSIPGVKKVFPSTFDYIMNAVSELINIPVVLIKSKSRLRKYVEARQLFTLLARDVTKSSLKTIGTYLGKQDHTSIIHSVKTYRNLMDTNKHYKNLYDRGRRMVE